MRAGGRQTHEAQATRALVGRPLARTIDRPRSACEGFEWEQARYDPKDGELCPSRAKPGETLVEARRCADVQIAFRTWV